MRKTVVSQALGVALLVGVAGPVAYADETIPKVSLVPAALQWTPNPALPGAMVSVLLGNPAKPGPYVVRVKFPPNFRVPVHFHPDDRTYTVLSGTLYVGEGDTYDAAKLNALPAGTFFTGPAKVHHFDATKGEEVIFQINGIGPSGTVFIDPADDPRKK